MKVHVSKNTGELLFDLANYEMIDLMFETYHSRNPSWGALHVALDEGNVTRDCIGWCRDYAVSQKDYFGAMLADMLLELPDAYLERIHDEPKTPVLDIIFDYLTGN
jgi:hypothetical protein